MPLTGNWTTECAVCGNHYQNGCGSTECCGAVQYLIDPESEISSLRELNTELVTAIKTVREHALAAGFNKHYTIIKLMDAAIAKAEGGQP